MTNFVTIHNLTPIKTVAALREVRLYGTQHRHMGVF